MICTAINVFSMLKLSLFVVVGMLKRKYMIQQSKIDSINGLCGFGNGN